MRASRWGGRALYATQYIPSRSGDGVHRKMRLVVAGDDNRLRHVAAAEGWHVHAEDRDSVAAIAERKALKGFREELLLLIRARILRITDVLQLD